MTADWDLHWKSVWRGKKTKTNHSPGRNDFVAWLVCREKHLRLISECRGSTRKCALEDEKCLGFFWHKKQRVWQARHSLGGKTLLSAAASQCESGWLRRCADPTRRLRLPETHKAAEQPRNTQTTTTFSFPWRLVLFFWGGGWSSRSVVCTRTLNSTFRYLKNSTCKLVCRLRFTGLYSRDNMK